jgi:hypothetical protein
MTSLVPRTQATVNGNTYKVDERITALGMCIEEKLCLGHSEGQRVYPIQK